MINRTLDHSGHKIKIVFVRFEGHCSRLSNYTVNKLHKTTTN